MSRRVQLVIDELVVEGGRSLAPEEVQALVIRALEAPGVLEHATGPETGRGGGPADGERLRARVIAALEGALRSGGRP